MQRNILTGGLLLLTALSGWAQDVPAEPERIEERHYVRRFSLGVSFGLTPLSQLPKKEERLLIESNPPVEFLSQVDPAGGRAALGINAQFTISNRWAVAIAPTYRKVSFTGFTQRFDGVDNSSTFLDERALTRINETTNARYFDIPILLRRYNIDHTESGKRYFWDMGATYRKVNNVKSTQEIDPPNADPFFEYVPMEHKSGVLGGVVGIGGQFIDDFGIRAIPEVRYTYWFSKPFDSIYGRSRSHQVEILVTISF